MTAKVVTASFGDKDVTAQLQSMPFPLQFPPAMNPNTFFGVTPNPQGTVLTLTLESPARIITLTEKNGVWTNPQTVHAGESTVSTQLFSGLGNQIYQIVNSCIIAAKTGRKLRFPFPLLSRKTASDPFRDVEFASLFDPDTFLKAASSFITTTTATGVFFFLYDERKTSGKATASDNLAKTFYSPVQHASLYCPFMITVPSNKTDFHFLMTMMSSLVPAPHLYSLFDKLYQEIIQLTIRHRVQGFAVAHCRIENDWKTAKRTIYTAAQFALFVRTCLPMAKLVYVMGSVDDDAYWKELCHLAPEYVWVRKQDVLSEDLGFEPGAVIDRELAVRADWFLGYASSSLSLVIALQRHTLGKPIRMYKAATDSIRYNCLNASTYFFAGGQPMFPPP